MRETLFQMQEHAGQFPFPTEIGHVTDAITFNTPHSGPNSVPNYFGCVGCTQAADMSKTSDFMSELSESGRNPQTSAGFTHWTVIGSECDPAVSASSAIDMDASHAIVYAYDETHNTCYDHSAALHDTRVVQDAAQFYCDTTNPGNSPCGTDYKQVRSSTWRSRVNGLRGLSQLYSSVTGRLPSGAERVGSSHRLWLLSTAATAWALLRR